MLRLYYPILKANFGGNQGIRYAINIAFYNAIAGEYPDFKIYPASLVFSKGIIDTAANIQISKSGVTEIKVDWDTTILRNSNIDDLYNLYSLLRKYALIVADVSKLKWKVMIMCSPCHLYKMLFVSLR